MSGGVSCKSKMHVLCTFVRAGIIYYANVCNI